MAKKDIFSGGNSVFGKGPKGGLFGKPSHDVVGSKDGIKKLLGKK